MKFKKWVEILLIIITIVEFVSAFFVEDTIGCLILLLTIVNIGLLNEYGGITNELNRKLIPNEYK